jgi:acid phosphatase type 7
MFKTSPRMRRVPGVVAGLFAGAIAALVPLATLGAETTPQLLEDSAIRRDVDPAESLTRVCEQDARWIRLGFASLVLSPGDTLTLTSSDGDQLVFVDDRWNTRSFHARALRGNCVDLQPAFSSSGSHYAIDGYDAGSLPLQDSRVTVAGAGDICDDSLTDCGRTADLIVGIDPTSVFTAGDNAYGSGTLAQFNAYFDPNWGRFKELISPTPGNHEYATSSVAKGYFDYFNGVGNQTGPAGDRSLGYYSYDVGEWHFIALNSKKGGTVASTQLAWLSADLAANTKPCTAAVFHFPLLSKGKYSGYASMKPYWDRLYLAKADLVIVGHDHNYQRYAKMNAFKVGTTDGVRQVIAGTGGAEVYPITGTHALLEASQSGTSGVVRLDLTPMAYTGAFVPVQGQTWTDAFSERCNKGIMLSPDYTVAVAMPTLTVVRGGSSTQTVTITSGGGFASSVRLSVGGLASGVTYSLSRNPVTPPANGQTTVTLTLRASATMTFTGGLNIKVKGTSGTSVRTTMFRLTVK